MSKKAEGFSLRFVLINTGNISRKVLSKVLRSFDKNFERLQSGYKVDQDIKIEFTGLRPGEKLYEELLMDEEGMTDTPNKLIHIGHPIDVDEVKLAHALRVLESAAQNETDDMRLIVESIVPTYHPN